MIKTYLINGFLQAGKTTYIQNLLKQEYFNTQERTLLLVCEEGETEYDIDALKKNNVFLVELDGEEECNADDIYRIEKEIRPNRVIVEYNGMWKRLDKAFPWYWLPPVEVAVFDASCFENNLQNMKSLVAEQVRYASMAVFNRCDGLEEQLPAFRRNIRAVNSRIQVAFEDKNGEMELEADDGLPYDLSGKELEITDDTFPVFYMDAMERVEQYEGKQVRFVGKILTKREDNPTSLAVGRLVMTCCTEDLSVFGFVCDFPQVPDLEAEDWVLIQATVKKEYAEKYQMWYPILQVQTYAKCQGPEQDVIARIL